MTEDAGQTRFNTHRDQIQHTEAVVYAQQKRILSYLVLSFLPIVHVTSVGIR